MRLNREQAKSLANFFFDVAKGLILGGIGLAVVVPWNVRILTLLLSVITAYFCIRFALSLLEESK